MDNKKNSDFEFVKQKISELLLIVNELEERFPGRKFTIDGHLFGSIGEVIAKYYYNIELLDKYNNKIHLIHKLRNLKFYQSVSVYHFCRKGNSFLLARYESQRLYMFLYAHK